MAIGKTKRFEIFKRDGFTCQYCGQRPPDVILEVDHIDPRAAGGSDDDLNLTTACFGCNRGKRDKKLSDVRPRPDADIEYLRTQQELAEAQRYLKVSKKLESARKQLMEHLERIWEEQVSNEYGPTTQQWMMWIKTFSPEEIEHGLIATARKRFRIYSTTACGQAIKYASAVMWHRLREQREGEQVQ